MRFEKLVRIERIKIDNKDMIMGMFTTPDGHLPGSGICIFSIDELNKIWQSDFASGVKPNPHPGACPTEKGTVAWNKLVSGKDNHQMVGKINTYKNQGNLTRSKINIVFHFSRIPKNGHFSGAIFSRTLFATERDTLSALGKVELEHKADQKEVYFVFMGTSSGKLIRSMLIVETGGTVDFKVISESNQYHAKCQSNQRTINKILFDQSKGTVKYKF